MTTTSRDLGCPHCGKSSRVAETRKSTLEIERRRVCIDGHSYWTSERVKGDLTIRRSANAGSRLEEFDQRKLEKSIALACVDLPPSIVKNYANEAMDRVRKNFRVGDEIPTLTIGLEVINTLRLHSPASAARYAMAFYTLRPEREVRVETIDDLVDRILLSEYRFTRLPFDRDTLPMVVSKRPKGAASGKNGDVEALAIEKLWVSLVKATRGHVLPTNATEATQPPILRVPAGMNQEEGYRYFVTVVTARVLRKVRGVLNVTSGSISSACVEALIEAHPLAAARYSTAAKSFVGPKGHELLVAEVQWVRERHAKLVETPEARERLHQKWNEVAAMPLVAEIDTLVKGLPL